MKTLVIISVLLVVLATGCTSRESKGRESDRDLSARGTGASQKGTMENTLTSSAPSEVQSKATNAPNTGP